MACLHFHVQDKGVEAMTDLVNSPFPQSFAVTTQNYIYQDQRKWRS
jgi:hypothetical protein